MNATKNGNASRRSWMAVMVVFGLLYLDEIASARPTFDRVKRESTAGVYDPLLNFAKIGENDIVGQINEEISGTVKERHKRLSDQRRAELETLLALGKLMNVIRGGRQLEANKTGRRKRATFDFNMKNLQKLFRLSGKLGLKGNAAYPVIS